MKIKSSPETDKIKKMLRERLRLEIIKKNIHIQDMAEILETYESRIYDIKNNKANWASIEYLIIMLNRLHVNVNITIAKAYKSRHKKSGNKL